MTPALFSALSFLARSGSEKPETKSDLGLLSLTLDFSPGSAGYGLSLGGRVIEVTADP